MGYSVIKPEREPLKEPKSVLKPGVIYLGDNGQAVCVKCAGVCASSGYDMSGQKMHAVTIAEAKETQAMLKEYGMPETKYSCESGCTTYEL